MPATATHNAVSAVVLNDAMPMAHAAPKNPSPRVLTSSSLTPKCRAATAMDTNICGIATRCAIRILFKGLRAAHRLTKLFLQTAAWAGQINATASLLVCAAAQAASSPYAGPITDSILPLLLACKSAAQDQVSVAVCTKPAHWLNVWSWKETPAHILDVQAYISGDLLIVSMCRPG